jgi:hypothetical protein
MIMTTVNKKNQFYYQSKCINFYSENYSLGTKSNTVWMGVENVALVRVCFEAVAISMIGS